MKECDESERKSGVESCSLWMQNLPDKLRFRMHHLWIDSLYVTDCSNNRKKQKQKHQPFLSAQPRDDAT